MDWQKSKSAQVRRCWVVIADVSGGVLVARLMNLSASQVSYRYLHSLIPTKTKGQFSEIEDAMLRASVNQNGTKSWTKVAKQVTGRTGSQCRDRWCDYLDPNLKLVNSWEKWEDDLITKMKEAEGKKWSEIAAAVGEGRSDLHVSTTLVGCTCFGLRSNG